MSHHYSVTGFPAQATHIYTVSRRLISPCDPADVAPSQKGEKRKSNGRCVKAKKTDVSSSSFLPLQFPVWDPFACIMAPVFLFFHSSIHLPQERYMLKEECEGWEPVCRKGRFTVGARERENKETERSVRCVSLIAPVFAFPPPLFPADACHHGLTGLFYRSPMALPFLSPFSLSLFLGSLFFSVFLYLSQGLLKDVCECVWVWCSWLKMRRWILRSIKECELETK